MGELFIRSSCPSPSVPRASHFATAAAWFRFRKGRRSKVDHAFRPCDPRTMRVRVDWPYYLRGTAIEICMNITIFHRLRRLADNFTAGLVAELQELPSGYDGSRPKRSHFEARSHQECVLEGSRRILTAIP